MCNLSIYGTRVYFQLTNSHKNTCVPNACKNDRELQNGEYSSGVIWGTILLQILKKEKLFHLLIKEIIFKLY